MAKRLVSLTVTDEAGLKSDSLRIVLENGDGELQAPTNKAELNVRLGYEHSGTQSVGKYIFDELSLEGPPDRMIITARAANMRGQLKEQKTRLFHEITIGDLVTKIAAEQDYEARVFPSLAGIVIRHIDQTEESDMHLLTRLMLERDAVFKPANGMLIVAPKDQVRSYGGQIISPISLDKKDTTSWRFESVERGQHKSVKSRWRDRMANTDVEIVVGDGGPSFMLRNPYPDAETARAAAASKLAELKRGAVTLNLRIGGTTQARAEAPLVPSGFGSNVDGVQWVIQRVVHISYLMAGLKRRSMRRNAKHNR